MNVVIDPLWPWSGLWAYLTGAGPAAVALVVAAGVAAFVLPVLTRLRPFGLGPRALFRGAAVVVGVFLALLLFNARGTTGGVAARAQGIGLALLVVVPLALAGLTVWAYLGVPNASRRRIAAVLALRLAAFLVVLLIVARPSLGFPERNPQRSLLFVALDASRSMTIRDEAGNRSRWELMLRKLGESRALLDRLRDEQQVDVVLVRFAGDVSDFQVDEPGEPDGSRTDTGNLLRTLYERREAGRPLRGLLVVSDGADNGTTPALAEAGRWRNLPCPVNTFGCGSSTTSDRQKDVAITAIATEPSPVPAKGKLTARLLVDAPGFENSTVRARLFLDDKEVLARDVALPLTAGNEVKLECDAPATPGEVKLKVVLDVKDDLVPGNNTIETFVTVSKEGISVLLVDRQRAWEPQMLCDALARDPRIRVVPVWLRGERPVDANAGDLFQFDSRQYDAIILGDVTARQVRAVNPHALEAIEKQVAGGAGFLMLGGYSTFDNGDWKGTEIERLLPVELVAGGGGQIEEPVHIAPTEAGLRRFGYLLRLEDGKDAKAAWERLPPLEGMTRLGGPRELGTVLAESAEAPHRPVLVTGNYDKGRTLAFAGDTTHRWVRDVKSRQMHSRFWRQVVIWLARQEDAEGSVWVKPDTRRLPVKGELGFAVGVRSRGGVDLAGGTYQVAVVGPDGVRTEVPTAAGPAETRGTFARTEAPGEYRIEVKGEAKDPTSGEVVRGETSARFLVYAEELEMTRRAADRGFLEKLAAAGGGDFRRVEDLPAFVQQLVNHPLARSRPRLHLVPDWRAPDRDRRRPSGLLFGVLGAFVALLAAEWLLRRRWGLV
jgi:uncharacterized membrane protein